MHIVQPIGPHLPRVQMSSSAAPCPPVVLLAAPPLGPPAWDEVRRRLSHHGLSCRVPDLFDTRHAGILAEEGTSGLVRALADDVAGCCVVAHGLAVPLALHLTSESRLHSVVLSNGPVGSLDPFTAVGARLARVAGRVVRSSARPWVARPALASSAALRRLVVNPYVMERAVVDHMTSSWTADRHRRSALVRWLRELPSFVASAPRPTTPTLLVWGDEDPLYPAHVADHATGWSAEVRHVRVPGGQHFHIVERPWELADAVAEHLEARPEPT